MESTERILNALKNNEFQMYPQYIVDNKTKEIVLAEALSRWECPQKGLIFPGEYIAEMERSGLIGAHDFYIFELVCRQLEKWSNTDLADIAVSCNFTRITLSEENFIDRLREISSKYTFDREKLAIEISDDAIETDREKARENVRRCKEELGFRVFLDDLGSGHSALADLCDYRIDAVKIDRGILLRTALEEGKAVLREITALAHRLGISVICEGVETEEQNEFVSQTACDYIQGWYYAKAMPTDECEAFVEKYRQKKQA